MGTELGRRTLLRSVGLTLGALAIASVTGCSLLARRDPIDTVGEVAFGTSLRIPPLAEASVDAGGVRVFDLTLQSGMSDLVPQGQTSTWGVNGTILGPTLRVRRGETVRMDVHNTLDEATSLHWHGMRLPALSDGGPHQMVDPGRTWSPSWTINQEAATLWYHPHPHGATERHVLKGIGGMILIDDDAPASAALPGEYGVDDVPLILQDRTFDDAGAFVETDRIDVGMLGDTLMVNGTVGPEFAVSAELTRFRVLNASAARSYNLGFSDDRTFALIATDGGLLAAADERDRIMLSPGERAEIVVAMTPGEEVTLRSYPQDLGVSRRLADRMGGSDTLDVLRITAPAQLRASTPIPAALGSITPLDPSDAIEERIFDLGDNTINGLAMDMERIDATVTAETVEVWTVTNVHNRPHNFHIHDVQFLVLDIDGAEPPADLAGWKDTIFTPPGVVYRLIMRFGANSDPKVPYMFHCHLLWHEDQGMMGQFVVV